MSGKKILYPTVVILDINYSGYGVVRSLFDYGIDLIAFKHRKEFVPESNSRLLNKVITYSDEDHLYKLLSEFRFFKKKPILYLNSDYYVKFIVLNRKHFQSIFNIIFPDNETIELLLNKNQFSEFAIKNEILIPITYRIKKGESNLMDLQGLEFPIVIKPPLREKMWGKAGYPKVFYCNNKKEYKESCRKAFLIENELIVQEYIPGGDSDIYFCLVYYDNNSNCLVSFVGKKIRQWKVDIGSTASATISNEEYVEVETIRIFDELKYKGFGSIEYKRNPLNGKFYLMEPTVGRLNQQEYVATLHGVNLPLVGYKSQTHLDLSILTFENENIIYIDEWMELKSTVFYFLFKNLKIKKWYKGISGKRAYRYWNKKDPLVFFISFFWFIRSLILGFVFKIKSILPLLEKKNK